MVGNSLILYRSGSDGSAGVGIPGRFIHYPKSCSNSVWEVKHDSAFLRKKKGVGVDGGLF